MATKPVIIVLSHRNLIACSGFNSIAAACQAVPTSYVRPFISYVLSHNRAKTRLRVCRLWAIKRTIFFYFLISNDCVLNAKLSEATALVYEQPLTRQTSKC